MGHPSPLPPAGWYPDPSGAPGQRYFDGSDWTQDQAPAPRRHTRRILIFSALGIVALLIAGVVAFSGGRDRGAETAGSVAAGGIVAGMPGIGREVRDGPFAFVVNDVTRRGGFGTLTPKGEWVLVSTTVTNVDDQPQSFAPEHQKLYDETGREYLADGKVAIAANENRAAIIDMAPGFSTTVWVPFDVPAGTPVAVVKLHGSATSEGVQVGF